MPDCVLIADIAHVDVVCCIKVKRQERQRERLIREYSLKIGLGLEKGTVQFLADHYTRRMAVGLLGKCRARKGRWGWTTTIDSRVIEAQPSPVQSVLSIQRQCGVPKWQVRRVMRRSVECSHAGHIAGGPLALVGGTRLDNGIDWTIHARKLSLA